MRGVNTSSAAAQRAAEDRPRLAGPSLALDQPLTERTLYVHDLLTLSGWAVSPAGVHEVTVELGGGVYQAAGGSRALIWPRCSPMSTARATAGSSCVSRRPTSLGDRTQVEVRVADEAGATASLVGVVELQPFEPAANNDEDRLAAFREGRTEMWCDESAFGEATELIAPARVSGWAHCGEGIESVFVDIDDRLRIEATYGFRYPLWFADGSHHRVGFAVTIDPRELGSGRHVVTVVALGRDGRAVGRRGEVICLEPSEPGGPPSRHDAPRPVAALADGSRYVPEAHEGLSLEAEHHVRYRWAAALVPGRRVLDVACGRVTEPRSSRRPRRPASSASTRSSWLWRRLATAPGRTP